jgi:hypothetical protein
LAAREHAQQHAGATNIDLRPASPVDVESPTGTEQQYRCGLGDNRTETPIVKVPRSDDEPSGNNGSDGVPCPRSCAATHCHDLVDIGVKEQ